MKAIIQSAYGSADVLRLAEIDKPVPADDEVLVRVHAASIDAGTVHLITGLPRIVRLMGIGFLKPRQPVPGYDLSGRVEAIGKNVTRFQPGGEVFGSGEGAFAEFACAKEEDCAPKPGGLTFEQASAVAISGCTALQALRDAGNIQPGQRVLVIGAAGGVGHFSVQLAKAFGAEVTGVCSTGKLDLVRSLGADHVIDYTREDFTSNGRRYDIILDIAGRRSLSKLRRCLRPQSRLIIVGGDGGNTWTGGFIERILVARITSLFVSQKLTGFIARVNQKDLLCLKELIEAGKLKPVIDRVFPLKQAADAVRHWNNGHAKGKTVVKM
jgi:2-desacetyl-2-hydroxyethyl bacteriochlorophyllide A dehydrogenase